ncbi:hypothetical protein E0493_19550 [Roseomonas sp. M0104]|uniref:Uncharacterized protein n=1 Tax=Teichococcus coralli TaxID=2545983 RepID=A0A845BJS8_9PROT|nr:hypothetical protein [Pseudoroseomonas coralli]MXP65547.1 hypothetical protein [Pseudoroseomonas coralli]
MSPVPRQARLELDAALRCPLPRPEAEALVALLTGRRPAAPPPHALFHHPEAVTVLTGESLDHATTGSRILQEEAVPQLTVSASLPPRPGLLEAALDWLGGLLQATPGDLLGFIVPPGSHRHDLRLLVWDGSRPRPLGPLPETATLAGGCSMAAFQRAAGLPEPDAPAAELVPAMRRVALAQLQRRTLPVAQALLDGPFDGQVLFRTWLAAAAAQRQGFSTRPSPLVLDACEAAW